MKVRIFSVIARGGESIKRKKEAWVGCGIDQRGAVYIDARHIGFLSMQKCEAVGIRTISDTASYRAKALQHGSLHKDSIPVWARVCWGYGVLESNGDPVAVCYGCTR